ncbi:MAG: protease inhibitor I42 family protein [Dehalococcoidales bacterium]|nr:protease inhibitor I42 family protein [Dehalococcoidales bacterium]
MKLKISVVILILIAIISLASCTGSNIIINVNVTCEEFEYKNKDLENEFEIKVGDFIKAKMCANPTTGYSWDYVIGDDSVVKLESHEFIESENASLGASGIDIWLFKAVKEGETVIKMNYSRPWEGESETERTYTLDVTVIGSQ